MKHPVLLILGVVLAGGLLPHSLPAQARDIPSAAPPKTAGKNQEERGRHLLDQMVEALGGQAWLNRTTMNEEGHIARFFRGAPTGSVVDFWSFRQFGGNGREDLERIEFTKKREVVQIWTKDTGYELTYKGKTTLPKPQVDDYLRRRSHSIEEVIHTWIKQPGVIVLAEGTSMVERRMVDTVTVLGTNNDAVTIDLDVTTHLPLRRTFQWRNETFKDHDEDAEEYDDYHTVQGLPTAFSITRYRNGDMASQLFIKKVSYGDPIAPEQFDPNRPVKKVHNLT
ncbi:MAG: hypothetical protein ABI197_10120 [Granulicella sp.]